MEAFWSPRMKAQIMAVLNDTALDPVALAALQDLSTKMPSH
ncbi:MAG: formate dehydrogenase subunit delta [Rhizobiales bacterium]|nr:formate dehydrogenase subunit delta [Hyphomicrobiales bacterium]